MSARISTCWISVNILLGFVLAASGEHFYLPKENNVFSNDFQDDWVPVSGVDKRSTRLNHAAITPVVHITPPVRYPNRANQLQLQQQEPVAAGSNKVEVYAQAPPTILGSFSEFGHQTIEAREPVHALSFRPTYNFDRHYEEADHDRRYQTNNDYRGGSEELQKPPAIVVFNAQQRHPQTFHKSQGPPPPPPPPQFYQNFQYHQINTNLPPGLGGGNKNSGFKEPPPQPGSVVVQEPPPKRLTPYYVPNDHIFPRPQGNSKQVYAEQRPKPYLVSSSTADSTPSQQQQLHHSQHHHQHQHQHQYQHQQHHQQQQKQQQPFKASTEVLSSTGYFQKYPGHVVDTQTPYAAQVSNFARPFEQTSDHSVYIKPNQHVHDLHVGTEMRFGPLAPHESLAAAAVLGPLQSSTRLTDAAAGFTHPATRPFSKYQTPSPKNEELYRIFPVKEVNALPAFLPTPVTQGASRPAAAGPYRAPYFKDPSGGSSEYDTRDEQDENESGEQYDVLRSPTKPMATTSTTTSTTAAPPARHHTSNRKRKPSVTSTSTTTSTSTSTTTTSTTPQPPPPPPPPSEEYDEYSVPNLQQLQLQEQRPEYDQYQPLRNQLQQYNQFQDEYQPMTVFVTTTERPVTTTAAVAPLAVSVNKYKKKKPASRPKEQQPQPAGEDAPERMTLQTASSVTTAVAPVQQPSTSTAAAQPEDAAAADTRAKTKAKYGNGTRPRFSIKDYKTTTTTTTTTTTSTERSPSSGRRTTTAATDPETAEQPATTTVVSRKPYKPRPRPNRYKSGTSTAATAIQEPEQQQQQETTTTSTERATYRSKYKPGKYYNRLRTTSVEPAAAADDGGS